MNPRSLCFFLSFLSVSLFFIASKNTLSARSIASKPKQDSAVKQVYYLELKGVVKVGKSTLHGASVKVYIDSSLYFTTESDIFGKCIIKLPIGRSYVIKVAKPGYATKIITANTKVPKDKLGNYLFKFTIDIFEYVKGLDIAVLQKPIARIEYNTFNETFNYDYNYTARINKDIKQLYDDYYLLEKAEADSLKKMEKKAYPKK